MENLENEVMISENNNVLVSDNNWLADGLELLNFAKNMDALVEAQNTIMKIIKKVTNENDWVLIGGNAYLQETGASKIASTMKVSWQIKNIEVTVDAMGYKTFTYTGLFSWCGRTIEAIGSRSMKDDFFAKVKDKEKSTKDNTVYRYKTPDEIDERIVKQSAYTSCIGNGVKRLLPGLRGCTIEELEEVGLRIEKMSGYTFKTGSKSGSNNSKAESSGLVCDCCGKDVSQRVASFAQSKFGRILCMDCQKQPAQQEPLPEPPPVDDNFPF